MSKRKKDSDLKIIKPESNLYYKILKELKISSVQNFRQMAKTLDCPEELIKIAINSLEQKGYLSLINDTDCQVNDSFTCHFCPFSNSCSERVPSLFYELTQKGQDIINKYQMRYNESES